MRLAFQPTVIPFYNHYYPGEIGIQGLGLGATDQQITATFGTIGSAIPVAGPFIALAASVAVAIENLFSGCGQTCVQASNIANQVGNLLAQNVQNYVANKIRTTSMQAAALQTFDQAWAQLSQACGNPQLGAAGQRCISDRQRGACTWKASPGGWNPDGTYTFAGPAGSGTDCWNWFLGYRDPIANDPGVVPDAMVTGPVIDNTTSSSNAIIQPFTQSQSSSAGGTGGTSTVDTALTQSVAGIPLPLILIGGGLLLLMAVRG